VSFYIDSNEQREKARRAEARLLEHSVVRPQRHTPVWDEPAEISALPPVFRVDGRYPGGRETSVEKRDARFRDTHLYGPPPPPPVHPDEIQRLVPPTKFLVPQHLADRGLTNDPRYAVNDPQAYAISPNSIPPAPSPPSSPSPVPFDSLDPLQRVEQWLPPDDDEYRPRYRMTPNGFAPILGDPLPAATPAVSSSFVPFAIPPEVQAQMGSTRTGSQKRRQRRKEKKRAANGASRPAPFPLQIDQQVPTPTQNGHAPTPARDSGPPPTLPPPPEPDPQITQTQCDAIVRVIMPNGSQVGLRCPLRPFPHPNQPHLVQLEPAPGYEDTSIFIGWWNPGE
jgi:hypothetical protein